ncbi:MAG: TIGR04372 family glycosyltransferase [Elusimicrobia bacterium]|nr:TIGR04372 family glycosyltransferase [Elusimicrobiota bacterium]
MSATLTAPSSHVVKRRADARQAAIQALKPLFAAAGLLAYVLIRLLEPWRRVRVGMLPFERIGHQSINLEIVLRRLASDPSQARVLPVFLAGPPANQQLLDMAARKVCINKSPWARQIFLHGLLPLISGGRFHEDFEVFLGYQSPFWNSAPPQFVFTAQEEERGRRLLASMGVPEGAPFICFMARDTAYLDKFHPHKTRAQWSYHDYRNCSAENFLLAAERLAEKGIYSLRMGAAVEKPLPRAGDKIIDYASLHRSDFGDIYLTARCKFFLGSEAGFTAVPGCFNVPTCGANMVPIAWALPAPKDIYIVKKHLDLRENRLMRFSEVVAAGADHFLSSDKFRDAGIGVVENTPEEIAGLAEEMNARIDGTWTPGPEDEELQKRYFSLFPPGHKLHASPSRVGAHFLRANRELLS